MQEAIIWRKGALGRSISKIPFWNKWAPPECVFQATGLAVLSSLPFAKIHHWSSNEVSLSVQYFVLGMKPIDCLPRARSGNFVFIEG